MALQNRVDPYGNLCVSDARGTMMGNRGCLHNERQQITKNHQLIRWITCTLTFKDYYRKVMTKGRYTELFFLDEVTAFAAGHRPCAECQRARYTIFKSLWENANDTGKLSTPELDAYLHSERTNVSKPLLSLKHLPSGTMVEMESNPFLVFDSLLYQWTFQGYLPAIAIPDIDAKILTPLSIVRTFDLGFKPKVLFG